MTDIQNPRFSEGGEDISRPYDPHDPRVYGGLGEAALFGDAHPVDAGFVAYEHTRETAFVIPDSYGKIHADANEEARLAVSGLEGNSVLAVIMDNMKGTRAAYINHMTPLTGRIAPDLLPDHLKDLLYGWVAVRGVLLTEGRMVIDPDTNDLAIAPKDPSLGIVLGQVIKREFGEATHVDVIPYTVDPNSRVALLVDLPKEGGSHILTARVPRPVV